MDCSVTKDQGRRKIEPGGTDPFLIPDAFVAASDGQICIKARAWFEPGQADKLYTRSDEEISIGTDTYGILKYAGYGCLRGRHSTCVESQIKV